MKDLTLQECSAINGGVIGIDDVLLAICVIDIALSMYSLFSK